MSVRISPKAVRTAMLEDCEVVTSTGDLLDEFDSVGESLYFSFFLVLKESAGKNYGG